jgi:hypothetical protein
VCSIEQRVAARLRTLDQVNIVYQRCHMGLSQQCSFRVLAAVFCSIGVLGIVDGSPATWTVLTLAGLSALLLPALLSQPALVPAGARPRAEVAR